LQGRHFVASVIHDYAVRLNLELGVASWPHAANGAAEVSILG
jgi:hypothetical protein